MTGQGSGRQGQGRTGRGKARAGHHGRGGEEKGRGGRKLGANACTCLCRDLIRYVEMARDRHQLPSPALRELGNFKHSGGHQETGKGEYAGQRRRGKNHQDRLLSTPNSVLYPFIPTGPSPSGAEPRLHLPPGSAVREPVPGQQCLW